MGSRQTASLKSDVLPLSVSQREVWLDQRAWPGSAHLNIGGGVFLSGRLDEGTLRAALGLLVNETESLRLAPLTDGTQRLLPAFEAALELVELDDLPSAADAHDVMCEWCRHRMSEPFILGERPPWRFAWLRDSAGLHCLSIQFHHLIMDGWGTTLLIRRWSEIYNALLRGRPAPAAAGASYRHYVEESRRYRCSPAFAGDAAYWQRELMALPAGMSDPRVVQRDARVLPPAHVVAQGLQRAAYAQLCSQVAQRGYTAFGCFLAALALYLWRTSGREDLVVGVPCLNRAGRHLKQTPGMFVGLVALRLRLSPAGMTAALLLEQVRQQIHGMLRHSRYPLSELGPHLHPLRLGRQSLMDVLLSFERQDYRARFGDAEFTQQPAFLRRCCDKIDIAIMLSFG